MLYCDDRLVFVQRKARSKLPTSKKNLDESLRRGLFGRIHEHNNTKRGMIFTSGSGGVL